MATLARKILESFEHSVTDNKSFVPEQTLPNILTHDCIAAALQAAGLSTGLAQIVHNKVLKTFAILIRISRLHYLDNLLAEGFSDADLPVHYFIADEPGAVRFIRNNYDEETGQTEWTAFRSWDENAVFDFFERQWQFLAPIFEPDVFEYRLHRDAILPFTWKGQLKEGGFGQVYQVIVHEHHLRMDQKVKKFGSRHLKSQEQ
jgi:hypothetical protein